MERQKAKGKRQKWQTVPRGEVCLSLLPFALCLLPFALLDPFACELLSERAGNGGVEAVLLACLPLVLGGDVVVALLGEGDDLGAQLLALGEAALDFLLPLLLRQLAQLGGQVFILHRVELDRAVLYALQQVVGVSLSVQHLVERAL